MPPTDGRQVDDDVGPRVVVQPADAVHLDEVVVAAARDDQRLGAARAQRFDDVGAEKPGAAGDDDALVLELHDAFVDPLSARRARAR